MGFNGMKEVHIFRNSKFEILEQITLALENMRVTREIASNSLMPKLNGEILMNKTRSKE
jgi:hypothetical protein